MHTKFGFSPTEAAAALGVGRTLIFEAMREGKLERRKAGRRTIIPAASLEAFLAACPTSTRTGDAG
jgi:excisionase family DNA binding protein